MFESGENYLETILVLHQKLGHVRSVDVASALGFTKPSVSRAMSILRKDGYILFDKDNSILLTELGREKAESVYERHRLITQYLCRCLNVPPDLADADACRIEHVISETTFAKMKDWLEAHPA